MSLAKIELIRNFKNMLEKIDISPNVRNIVVDEEIAKTSTLPGKFTVLLQSGNQIYIKNEYIFRKIMP